LLEILTEYNLCEVRIADAHRISIENSKFLGGASVNLLDVSIFHWLISMEHLYLQSLLLARISALRLNFAVTEGLHFYWAGDVEHTHLVKGLDYALLHKIRSEIDKRPEDDELVENAKHR
jgi:hypothetical protein